MRAFEEPAAESFAWIERRGLHAKRQRRNLTISSLDAGAALALQSAATVSKRLVESLKGVGNVYAGGELLRTTPYDLKVWATDGPTPSVEIEGHIDVTGIGEAVVLAGPDTLTLHLDDGRRLAFTLTASTGHIVGIGGLQKP